MVDNTICKNGVPFLVLFIFLMMVLGVVLFSKSSEESIVTVPEMDNTWEITTNYLSDCDETNFFATYYNNPDSCLVLSSGNHIKTFCDAADLPHVDTFDDDTCEGEYTTAVYDTGVCEARETKYEVRDCFASLPDPLNPAEYPWDIYVSGGEYSDRECGLDSHQVTIYWKQDTCMNSYIDGFITQVFSAHDSNSDDQFIDLYLYESDDCTGTATIQFLSKGDCFEAGDKNFQVHDFST